MQWMTAHEEQPRLDLLVAGLDLLALTEADRIALTKRIKEFLELRVREERLQSSSGRIEHQPARSL